MFATPTLTPTNRESTTPTLTPTNRTSLGHAHFNAHKPRKPTPTLTTTNRPQTSNPKYERGYLRNYQRQRIGISELYSVVLNAAQVLTEMY